MHNNLNTKDHQVILLRLLLPKHFHLRSFTTEKLHNYVTVNDFQSSQ